MSKFVFKPTDFDVDVAGFRRSSTWIAARANELLDREREKCVRVYGRISDDNTFGEIKSHDDVHTALLFDVEEIKK